MALLNSYSLYDSVASSFSPPFFLATTGLALRQFSDVVNRVSPDNPLNVHPADFFLYHIGSFDTETGLCVSIPPVRVGTAVEYLTSSK